MAAILPIVNDIYSALISWTYVLLAILIIVKLVQLAMSFGFIKGLGGGGGSGSGGGGSGGSGGEDDPDKKKKEKTEREKFEEGIENPANLKVWARNQEDKNLDGVEITIYAKKNKKDYKYGPHTTNRDGLVPATGEYMKVPSGVPIAIKYVFWLDRDEKYKSNKRSLWLLGLSKRRKFANTDTITLGAGEERIHEIKIKVSSEYAEGFEPVILEVDTTSEPGIMKTKGKINSMTG
jgi:hypothetical protein